MTVVAAVAIIAWGIALVTQVLLVQLLERAPILIVALNPTNANLALVSGDEFRIDALPYYVVGFTRHIFTDPFYYLLGLWYGDKAISWMSGRSKGFGDLLKEFEGRLKLIMSVAVFISPTSIVCVVAGALNLRFRRFIFLDALGTIGSLVLIRWLGERFSGPVDTVTDFITRYPWQVGAVLVLSVVFTIFRDTRSGSSSLLSFVKKATKKD